MTKTDFIAKASSTLDKALAADDNETRDALTRVAATYANLCNFVTE